MAGLDEHIFGYRKGRVNEKDKVKLANTLLKLGISSSVSPDGAFTLRERDRATFLAYARSRMHFSLTEPLGLFGFFLRNRSRYGFFLGLLSVFLVFFFTSGLVWDVRISGNENLPDYVIESYLDEHGFGVGSYWSATDKNSVEADVLISHPDIAWISVNRRGTVAYVEVIESENVGITEEVGPLYSNIVADRDGVIEEISVERGVATVKVGDVVKAGDILISGIIESESGTVMCRAQGTVIARGVMDVSVEAPREITVREAADRTLTEARIVLFNFSINIFKNYRNCEQTCDIIEETREIVLFDRFKLPIRIEKSYAVEYTEANVSRSQDEMTVAARRELDSMIYSLFKDASVLKLRTFGEFVGDVYRLTSRVVYSTDIGKESEIQTN